MVLKSFHITGKSLHFLRFCLNNCMPVRAEEDMAKKFQVFGVLSKIVDGLLLAQKIVKSGSEEEKALLNGKIEIQIEGDLIDWLKTEWKKLPQNFKIKNPETREILVDGFNGEDDLNAYMECKDSFENAAPVPINVINNPS